MKKFIYLITAIAVMSCEPVDSGDVYTTTQLNCGSSWYTVEHIGTGTLHDIYYAGVLYQGEVIDIYENGYYVGQGTVIGCSVNNTGGITFSPGAVRIKK